MTEPNSGASPDVCECECECHGCQGVADLGRMERILENQERLMALLLQTIQGQTDTKARASASEPARLNSAPPDGRDSVVAEPVASIPSLRAHWHQQKLNQASMLTRFSHTLFYDNLLFAIFGHSSGMLMAPDTGVSSLSLSQTRLGGRTRRDALNPLANGIGSAVNTQPAIQVTGPQTPYGEARQISTLAWEPNMIGSISVVVKRAVQVVLRESEAKRPWLRRSMEHYAGWKTEWRGIEYSANGQASFVELFPMRQDYGTEDFYETVASIDKPMQGVHLHVQLAHLSAELVLIARLLAFMMTPNTARNESTKLVLEEISGEATFIRDFLGAWYTRPSLPLGSRHTGRATFVSDVAGVRIAHHLRVLSARPAEGFSQFASMMHGHGPQRDEVMYARHRGVLESFMGDREEDVKQIIVEQRYSIWMTGELEADGGVGAHQIVTLTDSTRPRIRKESLIGEMGERFAAAQMGLTSNGGLGPLATFLGLLIVLVGEWRFEWKKMLESLNATLRVDLINITDPHIRRDLMFDPTFKRSEIYFTVLQLLRISSEWIRESLDDMKNLCEGLCETTWFQGFITPRDHDLATWQENIAVVREEHARASDEILAAIEAKRLEVESLRDGLYNATALREASRGTQINEYMFVFTIVTILYLPPSFISTLYGIDLFDWGGDDAKIPLSKHTFLIVIIAVSIGTYIAATWLLWRRRRSSNDAWTWWRPFRRRVKD